MNSELLQRSFLARVNPLLKIVVCIVVVSIAFSLRNLPAVGLLAGVLLVLLFMSIRLKLKTLLIAAIALLLFTAFATWVLGNLQSAILNSLRLLAILLPTPLLAATTPPGDLVRALQAAKLPSFLVLSLMLTWRFLPILQQEAQRILEANQLRGVNLSRQPQQWFPGLFVPLIFRIVSYADEVTVGLETRGYDPDAPRSMSQPLTWKTRDTSFALSSAFVLAIVCYLE